MAFPPHRSFGWTAHFAQTTADVCEQLFNSQVDCRTDISIRQNASGETLLISPFYGKALVDPAQREVRIDRHDLSLPLPVLEHFWADLVLPLLLDMEGRLVVHAAAICLGDEVCLIVGQSGWGKSTLSSRLHDRGAVLMSDDAVVVNFDVKRAMAQSIYPGLRLREDSLERVFLERTPDRVIALDGFKRRVDLSAGATTRRRPIACIVFINDPLEERQVSSVTVSRLSAIEACMRLMGNCFAFCRFDAERARNRLFQLGALAESIPAYQLVYRRNFALLDRVCETIESLMAPTSAG